MTAAVAEQITEAQFVAWLREECERDFGFFVRYFFKVRKGSKFVFNWHHEVLIADCLDLYHGRTQNLITNMPPRYGKAIDVATPMWTPEGWRPASDIRPGDRLLGSDGRWTTVTGVFPQGVRPAYDVRFSDGSSLVACGEHRWSARLRDNVKSRGWVSPWQTKTTDELRADLFEADGRKKWRIPVLQDTNDTDVDLPIDPYLFGCWLGDGHSHMGAITTMDAEILAAFSEFDPKPHKHQSAGRATTYGLRNGFGSRLQALGVLGDKRIPDVYMRGSHAQRLALLQGLCDTDGWVAAANGQQCIALSKKDLADDVRALVCSLGAVWRGYEYQPKRGNRAYRTSFSMPPGDVAFRLPRKIANINPRAERNMPRRFVASIEPVSPREMVCFSVDAPDRLFCAGRDFVVTHNTEVCIILFVAWCFVKNPRCEFIHLSYSDPLVQENSQAIREVIRSREFQQLWPHIQIVAHKNAKEAWATVQGGAFLARPHGGQVTGFGAGRMDEYDEATGEFKFSGCLLIDDPLKPDDARHDTLREGANGRWLSTIRSRRNSPRTPMHCIMQRIHEKDFTYELMRDTEVTGVRFRHRVLAARLDRGTPNERALWPAKHDLETLNRMREQRNERGQVNPAAAALFDAQYDQNPSASDGTIFRNDWWRMYADRDAVLRRCTSFIMTADTAFTEDKRNDPCVLQVWGFEGAKRAYLLDQRRGWWEMPELVTQARDFMSAWPQARRFFVEAKASGLSLIQTLKKQAPHPVKGIPWAPNAYHWPDDKVGRAQHLALQIHGGAVWTPSDQIEDVSYQPWAEGFYNELIAFNAAMTHAHDDQKDAADMAISVWVRAGGGVRQFAPKETVT